MRSRLVRRWGMWRTCLVWRRRRARISRIVTQIDGIALQIFGALVADRDHI